MKPAVLQVLPALNVGGVERGTLEVGKALVSKGYSSCVVSAGGRLVEQLEREGSKHFNMDIGKKSPLTFRFIAALRAIIKNNEINIVHVRSRLPAWVAYLALKGIPEKTRPVLISTVHGPYSVNWYSKVMLRADHIIAISEFIKDYIINNYPDTDRTKITVIHRGVDNNIYNADYIIDPDWLCPWSNHAAISDKKIITLPARITRWKGQLDFVEIIGKLRAKGLPVYGVIAGGAEKRRLNFHDEIQDKIKNMGLESDISMLGQRNDMKEIMKASDLVLSLAKIPEAFGRTALEALSLGTPVVAYDHGGAHEVLTALFPNGLVPANNIELAVDKVAQLCDANITIEKRNPFTLENMLEKTIRVYEHALNP